MALQPHPSAPTVAALLLEAQGVVEGDGQQLRHLRRADAVAVVVELLEALRDALLLAAVAASSGRPQHCRVPVVRVGVGALEANAGGRENGPEAGGGVGRPGLGRSCADFGPNSGQEFDGAWNRPNLGLPDSS